MLFEPVATVLSLSEDLAISHLFSIDQVGVKGHFFFFR
jgi:hypothetical protein